MLSIGVGILKTDFQQVTIGKQTIYYSYCGNFIISERKGVHYITLDDNFADDTLKAKFRELLTHQLSGELNTVIETFKNLK